MNDNTKLKEIIAECNLSSDDLKELSIECKARAITKEREDKEKLFEEEIEKQHREVDDIIKNNILSEAILHDKLSIFQYDYLLDNIPEECNISEQGNVKLEKMWSEIQFLLEYYKVL